MHAPKAFPPIGVSPIAPSSTAARSVRLPIWSAICNALLGPRGALRQWRFARGLTRGHRYRCLLCAKKSLDQEDAM